MSNTVVLIYGTCYLELMIRDGNNAQLPDLKLDSSIFDYDANFKIFSMEINRILENRYIHEVFLFHHFLNGFSTKDESKIKQLMMDLFHSSNIFIKAINDILCQDPEMTQMLLEVDIVSKIETCSPDVTLNNLTIMNEASAFYIAIKSIEYLKKVLSKVMNETNFSKELQNITLLSSPENVSGYIQRLNQKEMKSIALLTVRYSQINQSAYQITQSTIDNIKTKIDELLKNSSHQQVIIYLSGCLLEEDKVFQDSVINQIRKQNSTTQFSNIKSLIKDYLEVHHDSIQ